MKQKPWLAIFLLLALIGLPGCSGNSQAGTQAPLFTLNDLTGKKISFSDFLGKPVVINFWQLSCQPCIDEMPNFQTVYSSSTTAKILTVAIGNSSLTAFMADNNYSFPVLLDSDGQVSASYDVRYTPTTFFIDSRGQIVDVKVGAFTSSSDLEQAIKSLH